MSLNYSDDFIDQNSYTVGRVTVDGSFHTQNADENFFRFFGNDVIYSIKRIFEPDDVPLLENCIKSSGSGGSRKTVVRMRGTDSQLRWMLAEVRMLKDPGENPLYSITFSDIFSLEQLSCSHRKQISEYRHLLSMVNDLAFEYSFETRFIRIYMFDSFREIILVNQKLSQWRDSSLDAGRIPARYTETFRKLCSDIENGVYRFDYEFESEILSEGRNRELNLFRGITRYDDPEHRKVTGIISVINSRTKAKDINFTIETNRDSISELLNKRAITSYAQELIASKPSYNVNLIILKMKLSIPLPLSSRQKSAAVALQEESKEEVIRLLWRIPVTKQIFVVFFVLSEPKPNPLSPTDLKASALPVLWASLPILLTARAMTSFLCRLTKRSTSLRKRVRTDMSSTTWKNTARLNEILSAT